MATAKGSSLGVESDRKLHACLLHKLSGMLTKLEFKKLKHVFGCIGLVSRAQIDDIDDFFFFLAWLERLDYISVGRYDFLIEHMEALELNDCIRVIREHAEKINAYRRKSQGQEGTTPDEMYEGPSTPVEDSINKTLDEFNASEIKSSSTRSETANMASDALDPISSPLPLRESKTTELVAEDSIPAHPTQRATSIQPTQTQTQCDAPPSSDVNKLDEGGYTPLMRAAEDNDVASIRRFIDAGADLNFKDRYGQTALMIASSKGHKKVAAELIKAGTGVNITNSYGTTALIHASQNGHKEVVEELLKAGADVNIKPTWGRTALCCAEKNGYSEIAEMLKSATFLRR